jgi:hypothetical protein
VEGDTATCTPRFGLSFETDYQIEIDTDAEDCAGNSLLHWESSSFQTQELGTPPDLTPPSIVSTTPEASSHGVPRTTAISVEFSEAMDVASVESAFRVSTTAKVSGAFDWSADAETLTFWPAAPFAPGTFVTFEVGEGARDLSGNKQGTVARFVFRVLREATTKLACIDKLAGTIASHGDNAAELHVTPGQLSVGDRSGSDISYRSVLAFDMSAMPVSLTNVLEAELWANVRFVFGNPINAGPSSLGNLAWQHLNFGPTLGINAYPEPPLEHLGNVGVLSDTDSRGWKQTSVLQSVRNDWANRQARGFRSEYRLQFDKFTDNDAVSDQLIFGTCSGPSAERPYVQVRYEYP